MFNKVISLAAGISEDIYRKLSQNLMVIDMYLDRISRMASRFEQERYSSQLRGIAIQTSRVPDNDQKDALAQQCIRCYVKYFIKSALGFEPLPGQAEEMDLQLAIQHSCAFGQHHKVIYSTVLDLLGWEQKYIGWLLKYTDDKLQAAAILNEIATQDIVQGRLQPNFLPILQEEISKYALN